jgi:hypothetical protein
MKKTIHPGNHEDRKVAKLLESIAKKSASMSGEKVNPASAGTVKDAGDPPTGILDNVASFIP